MKENLLLVGGIIAVTAYLPTLLDVLKGAKQNFTTWALWATLDSIIATSLFFQHAPITLPVVYTIGSGSIALILLIRKNATWGKMELFITFLVVSCLIIWYLGGPRVATIATTLALGFASIPQMVHTWKDPASSSKTSWLLFSISGICCVIGEKAWTIEDRFFPISATLISVILLFLALRKKMKE